MCVRDRRGLYGVLLCYPLQSDDRAEGLIDDCTLHSVTHSTSRAVKRSDLHYNAVVDIRPLLAVQLACMGFAALTSLH